MAHTIVTSGSAVELRVPLNIDRYDQAPRSCLKLKSKFVYKLNF